MKSDKPAGRKSPVTTIPKDKNVLAVMQLLASRAETGLKKYGVTTEREDLSLLEWIDHATQEMLDGAVYLQKIKTVIAPLFAKP